MAPLIGSARSVREEARRLRSDSATLKRTMRSNTRIAETRVARARTVLEITRARREVPCASPWSGLHWLREDESLDRILLPVD